MSLAEPPRCLHVDIVDPDTESRNDLQLRRELKNSFVSGIDAGHDGVDVADESISNRGLGRAQFEMLSFGHR